MDGKVRFTAARAWAIVFAGHARRFQLLRLRTNADPTRTAPQKIPTIPTLVDRIEFQTDWWPFRPLAQRSKSRVDFSRMHGLAIHSRLARQRPLVPALSLA